MAGVVDRLGERDPHQPGRGDGAVEPGQRHHVDDGRDAAAELADQEAGGAVEFGLGGGVGAVAELVLEPHERMRVPPAVGQEARHQEAGQPLARRWASTRKASLIGADMNHLWPVMRKVPSRPSSARVVLAVDVAAALLLGHAHADGDALLLGEAGGCDESYWRERIFGSQTLARSGAWASAATAALVMVIGQTWPHSACAVM